MKRIHVFPILGFIVLYSIFIFFININIEFEVAAELTVASVFFFALFSGFFISRQNERYSKIIDIIAERDGLYSSLYRIFGLVPRIQGEMREIIAKHYKRILDSNNWAYNELNPSTTITRLTETMASIKPEEIEKIEGFSMFDGIWDVIISLQQNRKKILAAYNEKLLMFQWVLIYIFSGLVMVAFHFLSTDYLFVDILKVIFGTAVFLVIILIKQLNDLSIFGKDFSAHIARDVLNILEEVDMKRTKEEEQNS
jgi:hypothetical protein